jgi:hypothetical protein
MHRLYHGELREAGDRALLRAIHFFEEDRRSACEAQALKEGRFDHVPGAAGLFGTFIVPLPSECGGTQGSRIRSWHWLWH